MVTVECTTPEQAVVRKTTTNTSKAALDFTKQRSMAADIHLFRHIDGILENLDRPGVVRNVWIAAGITMSTCRRAL
jgi:hypothetical protein